MHHGLINGDYYNEACSELIQSIESGVKETIFIIIEEWIYYTIFDW